MPRYVAFLRGVSPQNAKMPDLKRCFEEAGFANVKTVLSSGNVVFDARAASEAALERKALACMEAGLGRSFYPLVRSVADLTALLATDPYARFAVSPQAKRVVSFLREVPNPQPRLPIEQDDARLLCLVGREMFTAYVPNEKGPVFMTLIQKALGTEVTTRTWETVNKCVAA
jgi:uncharacterized protein (DUF1697 family)